MSKDKALIAAVAYVRKSTKGTRSDGRQRQEKSLEAQRREILELAKSHHYKIIRWYEDEGVAGWKREAARPGFARMLADAKALGDFCAIVCDDADRFSRATWRKAVRDVDDLCEAGVRTISSVRDGDFRIDEESDPGEAHRLLHVAMAAHEFSRKLSRRVTLARRNAALEGKRTGGPAPYGLRYDKERNLQHGEPQKTRIVLWIFDQFLNQLRSLNWLAGDLNRRKVPSPQGSLWTPKTVGVILRQRAYRGDFQFNVSPEGNFYGIDASGEVAEKAKLDGAGKVFLCVGKYTPLIDTPLWDQAQARLERLARHRGDRKHKYALSGILVCDHCGLKMYGVAAHGKTTKTVYRCTADGSHGAGSCGCHQVREDQILPFVLRTLGEEITSIEGMLSAPPDRLRSPYKESIERRKQAEKEREELAAQIDKAEENVMFLEDARTRKSLDARISAMRDQLEELDAELAAPNEDMYSTEDLKALTDWWDDFDKRALSMPVKQKLPVSAHLYHDAGAGEAAILVDPIRVNEALKQLGCEVRLRWETSEYETSSGHKARRHTLVRGRFRLGQKNGQLPRYVLDSSLNLVRRAAR
jgi:DNA invertase Pin-like site-specific DNA recombinase